MYRKAKNMIIMYVVNKTFVLFFLFLQWGQCYCDISSEGSTFETNRNDKPLPDSKSDPNFNDYHKEPIMLENIVIQDEKQVKIEVGEKYKVDVHENLVNGDLNENSKVKSSKQSEEINDQELPVSSTHEGKSPTDGRRTGSVAEAISTNDRLPKPVKIPKKVKIHGIKPKLDVHGCVSSEKTIFHEVQANTLTKESNGIKSEEKMSVIASETVEEIKHKGIEESTSSHQELPKSQTEDVVFLSAAAEGGHNTHSEAMPSFDEWKKMMLAEQSVDGLKIPLQGPSGKKITSQKRKRNYASYECGAKIVGSNTEAEGTSRILNELFDEYMLNPCKAKIWFVIELCEAVQALQIELANFELFSSCPKDFAVYSSDHYPTRDWIPLGTFQALEQRVLQGFQLKQEGFGKFIKIELLSYYGKEHYCPLSVVRIFGTSMVDEYEEMETAGNIPISQQDDDDDREVHLDFGVENGGTTNLFGSATDAVLNIVKKAAQVLTRDQPAEGKGENGKLGDQQNISETKNCEYLMDSSESCSTVNRSKERNAPDSSLNPDIQLHYSSLYHSLFHYLHQCDSCIFTSKEQHQSMAPPTCRFFKAALGPVLYQGVCDFLKDNPATSLLPDSQISSDNYGDKVFSDTNIKSIISHSPPPTIISVIIDGPIESESESLPVHSNSFPISNLPDPSKTMPDSTPKLLHSAAPTLEGHSDNSKLEDHAVEPTKTSRGIEKDVLKSSNSVITVLSQMESQSTSNSGLFDDGVPYKSKIDVAEIIVSSIDSSSLSQTEKNSLLTDSSTIEAFAPSLETPSATNRDQFLESNVNVLNDTMEEISTKLGDVTVVSEEIVISAPDDIPEDLKIVDDKIPDIPKEDAVSKFDPTFSGGSLPTAGQKESVFMRMSNRIKALELNMSLSSQYLQELSQRYRRQMEEMQRAFNRTIGTLNDTARKAAERDIKQQDVIGNLQSQVANLTDAVELLVAERTSLYTKMIEAHVFLMVVEAIVMITILSLCVRRISSSLPCDHLREENHSNLFSPRLQSKRRNSADTSAFLACTKLMKRSISEEILTSEQNLLIVEPTLPVVMEPPPKVKKKYPKRKKNLLRSASNPSLAQKKSSLSSSLQNTGNNTLNSQSEDTLFAQSKTRSLPEKVSERVHVCENCSISSSGKCTGSTVGCKREQEREKRTYSSPFQNLTNGAVCSPVDARYLSKDNSKDERKFSFRKFLKMQKRDSV